MKIPHTGCEQPVPNGVPVRVWLSCEAENFDPEVDLVLNAESWFWGTDGCERSNITHYEVVDKPTHTITGRRIQEPVTLPHHRIRKRIITL